MLITTLGPGSTKIARVRTESANLNLESQTYLAIRLSHTAPASLVGLSLNGFSLLNSTVEANDGWIVKPINAALSVGDYLRFDVQSGYTIPALGAFLSINRQLKYLSNKRDLEAGKIWNSEVELFQVHLG